MLELIISLVSFGVGLGLIIFFAEQLVKGVVGTSVAFGISTFLISVVFVGFDPDNLAVGAVGSAEGSAGIALGSIIGAAMVAVAFAFGLSALMAPMQFAQVPTQVLVVPLAAVIVLTLVALDGWLSRLDGVILLVAFVLALLYLVRLGRRGLDIRPSGEVAESLEKASRLGKVPSLGLLVLSLAAIIGGSELLVWAATTLLDRFHISDMAFGMTILAFLVSIEEIARELPAARQGRPDITFANVAGSILASFLCNAGIIALVQPIPVAPVVLMFYLPVALVTTVAILGIMRTRRVSRWAGGLFIALYVLFVMGGWWAYAHES